MTKEIKAYNDGVRDALLYAYSRRDKFIYEVDKIACKYCSHKEECEQRDLNPCIQLDSEAIDLFIEHLDINL